MSNPESKPEDQINQPDLQEQRKQSHQFRMSQVVQNFLIQQNTPAPEQQSMASFHLHGKDLQYIEKSLYYFTSTNQIRMISVWIVEWIWFERFIILIILLNTLMLALQDYIFRENNTEVRIMRPLRSINSMKQMRILVTTLLDSLPALGNAVIFLFFIIILFGILGLQIFMGKLESRCRLTPVPVNGVWQVSNYPKLCSDDSDCPINTYFGNPQDYDLTQQEDQDESLNYGYTNFDNIIAATFTIFQALTTEGWSVLIEIFEEAVAPAIVYIYYLLLIFIGPFFVVNLILAVINDSFVNASKNKSLRLSTEQQQANDQEQLQQLNNDDAQSSPHLPDESQRQ